MSVAKSGRTTGLTCASISALNLDVSVDYYSDCAETKPYLTKVYTNQIAITGNQFSDAGDSGSLVVDSADAEPVGLFFAGGIDQRREPGMANPVGRRAERAQLAGRRRDHVHLCGRRGPRRELPQLRRRHGHGCPGAHARVKQRKRALSRRSSRQARMLVNPRPAFWAWPPARAATTPAKARSFSTSTRT